MRELFLSEYIVGWYDFTGLFPMAKRAKRRAMMGVAHVEGGVGVSVHYIIAIKSTTTSTQLTSFLIIMLFVQNSVQK